jgi:hypothetical protein
VEGDAQEARKLKRARVPTRTNHLGSIEGHGLRDGLKPLKRRYQAKRFDRKAPERRERQETVFRSFRRRKALKSEAQERRELKEAFTGLRG